MHCQAGRGPGPPRYSDRGYPARLSWTKIWNAEETWSKFYGSSQGESQVGAIEPADLRRCFPKTFLECIVVPNSSTAPGQGPYQDC